MSMDVRRRRKTHVPLTVDFGILVRLENVLRVSFSSSDLSHFIRECSLVSDSKGRSSIAQ